MELNNLSKADLSRKLGISRARVIQILNLLKFPEKLKEQMEGMSDYWGRRLVTETMLRDRIL